MKTIKAGVIGATGYAGVELVRLLLNHPNVELAAISSKSFEGQDIADIYPCLHNILQMVLTSQEETIQKSDVVFGSLPHGLSEHFARMCVDQNKVYIDLGADFRLYDEADYQQWYKLNYNDKPLHELSVYAMPEVNREEIKGKKIIGNPGCYPTSISLGLMPLLKAGLVQETSIIIDSKSGVTGAGRGLSQTTHYPDCNEAFSPYKIASHRHTPEIEQNLSRIAGKPVTVTFVPHLLPVNRGIVSTMYASLKEKQTLENLHKTYQSAYQNEPFVRVLPKGETANLKNVKYSNYCDISLHLDERTNRVIVVSAIDNMVKGAAGQAIQNMNLVFGLNETTGLSMIPPAF